MSKLSKLMKADKAELEAILYPEVVYQRGTIEDDDRAEMISILSKHEHCPGCSECNQEEWEKQEANWNESHLLME